jgi:16S rRNA (uracil1498-N3)-methyltransferase
VRQFLVPAVPAARPGAVLEIAGSDYHYLVRVLRLRPGAVIPVADAAGRRGRATVTAIDHRSARLLIAAERAETAAGATATETGTAAQPVAAATAARAAQPGHARQAAGSGNPATRAQATDAAEAGNSGSCARAAGAAEAAEPGSPGTPAQAARAADAAQSIGAGQALAGARVAEPAAGAAPGAPGALTLIQALPKGALMDRIVRQATELGVTRIVPVVAERTQGRAGDAAQARRRERWQRIARQAAQQSGAGTPVIEQPVPLRRYLEELPAGGLNLLFHPGADPLPAAMAGGAGAGAAPRTAQAGPPGTAQAGPSATAHAGSPGTVQATPPAAEPTASPPAGRAALSSAGRAASPLAGQAAPPLALRCAVGPEGGFSPAEAALFGVHGFRAVGLPTGLLRVDTAAVAALVTGAQFLLSLHAVAARCARPPLTGNS